MNIMVLVSQSQEIAIAKPFNHIMRYKIHYFFI